MTQKGKNSKEKEKGSVSSRGRDKRGEMEKREEKKATATRRETGLQSVLAHELCTYLLLHSKYL